MDERAGSVFQPCDDRSERAAAGIAQNFYHHQFGIGGHTLGSNSVDGSSYDSTHMGSMAELSIGREDEAGLGGREGGAQSQIGFSGNIDVASNDACRLDSDARTRSRIPPTAVVRPTVRVDLMQVPLYSAESFMIG